MSEWQTSWPLVGLAFVNMLQVVGLAWIAKRGVILPPTNRRTKGGSAGSAETPQEPS